MDLRELYQEVILDHNKRPRNFRVPDPVNRKAEGYNPLCGDKITVFLYVDGDIIRDLGFQGTGCAISKASASMMTTALKGKTLDDVRALFGRFHEVVTGRGSQTEEARTAARKMLGCLSAFSGVAAFPMRVKCATLAWHAMKSALDGKGKAVTE